MTFFNTLRAITLSLVVYPFIIFECVADDRVVYFVPNGFPATDSIYIVEDGNDERFCTLDLRGLDLARMRFGHPPCGSNEPRSDSLPAPTGQTQDVQALILVDDRSQLSPEVVRLLAGAIQQIEGSYFVVPFGIELRNQRNVQAGLATGARAMVVGERLYREHYKGRPSGVWLWRSLIDVNISSISAPQAVLETAEMDTDDAAREVFQRAVQHYTAGEFERAYWLFSDVTRIPGLGRPQAGGMIGITIAAQGGDAFLNGDYQRAFDAWHRFLSSAAWISEEVVNTLNESQQRIYRRIQDRALIWRADALLRTGDTELAEQLFSPDILEQARSSATRTELLETFEVLRSRHSSPETPEGGELSQEEGAADRAMIHYHRGIDLYLQERYLEAVDEFVAAYAERPGSEFLYNIAVAYEREQDYTQAADYFERYLLNKPDSPDSDLVRRRIDFLRTRALQTGQVTN